MFASFVEDECRSVELQCLLAIDGPSAGDGVRGRSVDRRNSHSGGDVFRHGEVGRKGAVVNEHLVVGHVALRAGILLDGVLASGVGRHADFVHLEFAEQARSVFRVGHFGIHHALDFALRAGSAPNAELIHTSVHTIA